MSPLHPIRRMCKRFTSSAAENILNFKDKDFKYLRTSQTVSKSWPFNVQLHFDQHFRWKFCSLPLPCDAACARQVLGNRRRRRSSGINVSSLKMLQPEWHQGQEELTNNTICYNRLQLIPFYLLFIYLLFRIPHHLSCCFCCCCCCYPPVTGFQSFAEIFSLFIVHCVLINLCFFRWIYCFSVPCRCRISYFDNFENWKKYFLVIEGVQHASLTLSHINIFLFRDTLVGKCWSTEISLWCLPSIISVL